MTLAQWIDATHDPLPDRRPPPPSLRAATSEAWGGAGLRPLLEPSRDEAFFGGWDKITSSHELKQK